MIDDLPGHRTDVDPFQLLLSLIISSILRTSLRTRSPGPFSSKLFTQTVCAPTATTNQHAPPTRAKPGGSQTTASANKSRQYTSLSLAPFVSPLGPSAGPTYIRIEITHHVSAAKSHDRLPSLPHLPPSSHVRPPLALPLAIPPLGPITHHEQGPLASQQHQRCSPRRPKTRAEHHRPRGRRHPQGADKLEAYCELRVRARARRKLRRGQPLMNYPL